MTQIKTVYDGDNYEAFFTALEEDGVSRKLFETFMEAVEDGLDYSDLNRYQDLLKKQQIYFEYDMDAQPYDIFYLSS